MSPNWLTLPIEHEKFYVFRSQRCCFMLKREKANLYITSVLASISLWWWQYWTSTLFSLRSDLCWFMTSNRFFLTLSALSFPFSPDCKSFFSSFPHSSRPSLPYYITSPLQFSQILPSPSSSVSEAFLSFGANEIFSTQEFKVMKNTSSE